MDDTPLLIKDYRHWVLHLNADQGHLGRMLLAARREDAVDFLDMTSDEREGFFQAGLEARRALDALFRPDLFNYASLGNAWRHLHVHLVPRYREPRVFLGLTFTDDRWGRNFGSRPGGPQLGPEQLQAIAAAIRSCL
jgi:diadenosine tetraphosphate (Ap4A) HIT family hydrolase